MPSADRGALSHAMDKRMVPGLFFSTKKQQDTMSSAERGTAGINQAVANRQATITFDLT
jgi:hypothetical protein